MKPSFFSITRSLAVLALGPICVVSTLALRAEEPARTPRNEWHIIALGGKTAGYLRLQVLPRADGGATTMVTQKLTLRRGTAVVDIETFSSFEENRSGKLLALRFLQKMSKEPMETVGVVEGSTLVLKDSVGGRKTRESRMEVPPGAVGPEYAEGLLRRKLVKPGDVAEAVLFFPEARRFGRQRAVLGPMERVDLPTGIAKLRRVTVSQDFLPSIETQQWFDDQFQLQKSSMMVFGMELVTYRSSLKDVLSEEFSSPPEIFLATSVPVRGTVRSGSEEITYRLTARGKRFPVSDDAGLFHLPGQDLVKQEGPRKRLLRVRRVRPKTSRSRPIASTPELTQYLRPSAHIQSDDAAIVKLAREAAGNETDAWRTACRLERWVFRNVRTKNLNTAFATAREVAERREGDCTEHAVLLAALLRAAGLPSRVAAGLVYYRGAFVGHMWTEVHLGEWIPLDATTGRGGTGPDHVAFAASSLASSGVSEFFLGMVPLLGNLEMEVVETRP